MSIILISYAQPSLIRGGSSPVSCSWLSESKGLLLSIGPLRRDLVNNGNALFTLFDDFLHSSKFVEKSSRLVLRSLNSRTGKERGFITGLPTENRMLHLLGLQKGS